MTLDDVLTEFGTAECVKRDDCTHFDCIAERKMGREIVRLRTELARVREDAERLEWMQCNVLGVQVWEPESDAPAWGIQYMNPADIEGEPLIASGGTLRETVDAARHAGGADA